MRVASIDGDSGKAAQAAAQAGKPSPAASPTSVPKPTPAATPKPTPKPPPMQHGRELVAPPVTTPKPPGSIFSLGGNTTPAVPVSAFFTPKPVVRSLTAPTSNVPAHVVVSPVATPGGGSTPQSAQTTVGSSSTQITPYGKTLTVIDSQGKKTMTTTGTDGSTTVYRPDNTQTSTSGDGTRVTQISADGSKMTQTETRGLTIATTIARNHTQLTTVTAVGGATKTTLSAPGRAVVPVDMNDAPSATLVKTVMGGTPGTPAKPGVPEDPKRAQVIQSTAFGILWGQEGQRTVAPLAGDAAATQKAKDQFGADSVEYLKALAKENTDNGAAGLAFKRSQEAQAEQAMYAADPSYRAAVRGAEQQFNKNLSPLGLRLTIPRGTTSLADARAIFEGSRKATLAAEQSLQYIAAASSDLAKLPAGFKPGDEFKMPGPVMSAPDGIDHYGAAVAAAAAAFSENTRLFQGAQLNLSKGAGFATDSQIASLQSMLIGKDKGSAEYKRIKDMLTGPGGALEQQKALAQSIAEQTTMYALAAANADVAGNNLRVTSIGNDAVKAFLEAHPHLLDSSGVRAGGRVAVPVSKATGHGVIVKDGQLYLHVTYANGRETDFALTMAPGTRKGGSDEQNRIDQAWGGFISNPAAGISNVIETGVRQQASARTAADLLMSAQNDVVVAGLRKKVSDELAASKGTSYDLNTAAAQSVASIKGQQGGIEQAAIAALQAQRPELFNPAGIVVRGGRVAMNTTGKRLGQETSVKDGQLMLTIHYEDRDEVVALTQGPGARKGGSAAQNAVDATWQQHIAELNSAETAQKFASEAYQKEHPVLMKAQSDLAAAVGVAQQYAGDIDRNKFIQAQSANLLSNTFNDIGRKDLDARYLTYTLQGANKAPVSVSAMNTQFTESLGVSDPTKLTSKLRELGGDNASVRVAAGVLMTRDGESKPLPLFIVAKSGGGERIVDDVGREYSDVADYVSNHEMPAAGRLYLPNTLSYGGDPSANVEITGYAVKPTDTTADTWIGIGTGIATIASFTPLAPVAAPLAMAGGTYLAVRSASRLVDMGTHGESVWSKQGLMEMGTIATAALPVASGVSRAAGLWRAGMTSSAAMRTGFGAVAEGGWFATPFSRDAAAIMKDGGAPFRLAKGMDTAAMTMGVPLIATSANDLWTHRHELSSLDLVNGVIGVGTGVFGTGFGIKGHLMTRTPHAPGTAGSETHASVHLHTARLSNDAQNAVWRALNPEAAEAVDQVVAAAAARTGAFTELRSLGAAARPSFTPPEPSGVPPAFRRPDGEAGARSNPAQKEAEIEAYVAGLHSFETPTTQAHNLFEIEQAGPRNYRVVSGKTAMDIDGYRGSTIIEVKFVKNADSSVFVRGSAAGGNLRQRVFDGGKPTPGKIKAGVKSEFTRLKAIIADPSNPFDRLEVVTNDERAAPYFQDLMKKYEIPGEVRVVDTEITADSVGAPLRRSRTDLLDGRMAEMDAERASLRDRDSGLFAPAAQVPATGPGARPSWLAEGAPRGDTLTEDVRASLDTSSLSAAAEGAAWRASNPEAAGAIDRVVAAAAARTGPFAELRSLSAAARPPTHGQALPDGPPHDIHLHHGGINSGSYDSRMFAGRKGDRPTLQQFMLFTGGAKGPVVVMQRVPQAVPEGTKYYLGQDKGSGVRQLEVRLVTAASGDRFVSVPETINFPNGRSLEARLHHESELAFEGTLPWPKVGGDAVSIVANVIPGRQLDYIGLTRDVGAMDEWARLPPEFQRRLVLGLTAADPMASDNVHNLYRALQAANQLDSHGQLQIGGIGETTLIKEGVTSWLKTGPFKFDQAQNLHNLLDTLGDVGGFIVVHTDSGTSKTVGLPGQSGRLLLQGESDYANWDPLLSVFKQHGNVPIVWAHGGGLGRSMLMGPKHFERLEGLLSDPGLKHVSIDLSWDVVAKQVGDPKVVDQWARLINRYPDRFMYGSDSVGAASNDAYRSTIKVYEEAGFLQKLSHPDAFLTENFNAVVGPAVARVTQFRTSAEGRELLKNYQLPAEVQEARNADYFDSPRPPLAPDRSIDPTTMRLGDADAATTPKTAVSRASDESTGSSPMIMVDNPVAFTKRLNESSVSGLNTARGRILGGEVIDLRQLAVHPDGRIELLAEIPPSRTDLASTDVLTARSLGKLEGRSLPVTERQIDAMIATAKRATPPDDAEMMLRRPAHRRVAASSAASSLAASVGGLGLAESVPVAVLTDPTVSGPLAFIYRGSVLAARTRLKNQMTDRIENVASGAKVDKSLDWLQRWLVDRPGLIGIPKQDRLGLEGAINALRVDPTDAAAMSKLTDAPNKILSPNTVAGRVNDVLQIGTLGINNGNTIAWFARHGFDFSNPTTYQSGLFLAANMMLSSRVVAGRLDFTINGLNTIKNLKLDKFAPMWTMGNFTAATVPWIGTDFLSALPDGTPWPVAAGKMGLDAVFGWGAWKQFRTRDMPTFLGLSDPKSIFGNTLRKPWVADPLVFLGIAVAARLALQLAALPLTNNQQPQGGASGTVPTTTASVPTTAPASASATTGASPTGEPTAESTTATPAPTPTRPTPTDPGPSKPGPSAKPPRAFVTVSSKVRGLSTLTNIAETIALQDPQHRGFADALARLYAANPQYDKSRANGHITARPPGDPDLLHAGDKIYVENTA